MKNFTNVKSRTPAEIVIPELEDAIARGETGKFGLKWTEQEEAILEKYYGRVETKKLLPHLPGKTINQIHAKAARIGVAGRKP